MSSSDDAKDTAHEVGPIPAGKAQLAVTMAFAAVARALGELETAALALEATATACARQLDATATEGGGR
jgi:hypothetical protein